MPERIAIIGDGGWGTALALVLHQSGHLVRVWGPFEDYVREVQKTRENRKFLPGISIPQEIVWSADPREVTRDASAALLAIPSRFFEQTVALFREYLPPVIPLLTVSKGLQQGTGHRMSEVASRILDGRRIAALSGPSHAEEVARGIPTAVVVAARDPAVAEYFQKLFATPCFRVYTSDDVTGVELGGALKNIIAIAAGISDGLGFGDNTKAALVTRGLTEISRLGCALGARRETFSGLSGLGDLVVTCFSRHSRNRKVGERLGRGESLSHILSTMEQVAEGVWTCPVALSLARQQGVEMPITEQVHAVLYENRSPAEAVRQLLARTPKPE